MPAIYTTPETPRAKARALRVVHRKSALWKKSGANRIIASNDPLMNIDADGNLDYPVEGVQGMIGPNSNYGPRSCSGCSHTHKGMDLPVKNAPLKALAAGKVQEIRQSKSYGTVLVMDNGDGKYSLFAHLSKVNVKVGQEFKEGDIVAVSGNSGVDTKGNQQKFHLHFEVFDNVEKKNAKYDDLLKIDRVNPESVNLGLQTNKLVVNLPEVKVGP